MSRHRLRRLVLGYLIATAMMWFLLGAVVQYIDQGAFSRHSFTERDARAEAIHFARARGLNRSNYQSMSMADRQQLEHLLVHQVVTSGPGVLWIAAGASTLIFAVLGLGVGFIRKAWPLAGLLPVVSLVLNNPVSGYALESVEPAYKFLIFICQCTACYIFAYLAAPRRHRI